MIYHPHDSLRDFLRDYLLMIDPQRDPVTNEPIYPAAALERAANSPWRLCMPMRTSDWMQIAVPTPARDGVTDPVLGAAVTAVLEGRCPEEGAETLVRDEIWDGMIMVPSRSDSEDDRIDALETASRIYTRALAASERMD